MKEYLIVIISSIIFLAIFEGLLPKGKLGNNVKSIISIVVVLIILNPIVKFFNSDFNYENILYDNSEYQAYLDEYKKNTLEKEIESTLKLNGYNVISVSAMINDNQNKVEIIIEKDEFIKEDEHIIILEKAKSLVIERFYLSSWEVIVA